METRETHGAVCPKCGAILDSANGGQWPAAIAVSEQLPDPAALVFVWKPVIDGWDIVLGREVVKAPELFTYWRPMMPRPG